jgi:hypothetical protein
MAYAIVQKELVVPELEQLKRAFTVSPRLTSLDAQTVANDAYGILLRDLPANEAAALREALLKEGVATELVEEGKLPTIPPAKIARQAEFQPTHLTLYDSMKRASEILWSDIIFIAAGYVRMREVRRHRTSLDEPSLVGAGVAVDLASGAESHEEQHYHLLLDIFLTTGTSRYSVTADEFAFDHLGARLSDDLAVNFVFLIQDLVARAPQAGLNRGAFKASQRPPELFPYPSKAAFHEEITWMLWRIGQLSSTQPAKI